MPLPRRRSSNDEGITAAQFFELAYGRPPDGNERALLDRLVQHVKTPSEARAVLLAFDQQRLPTTFQVRLGEDDLARVELDGFTLWLDRRDVSVSAVILDRRQWEPHIERVLRDILRPGDTFVDIGANVGYHTFLAASLVGDRGKVIAFEPDAENCRLLWLSRRENQAEAIVTIVPNALDRTPGLRYLATHLGSNGGLVETELEAVRNGRGVFVQAQPLDHAVDRPPRLMKVDVEGAELAVLDGASKLLAGADPKPHLIVEFSVEMTQRVSGVDPADAIQALLDDHGYHLAVLDKNEPGLRHHYGSANELLTTWGNPLRIEDLLFEPT